VKIEVNYVRYPVIMGVNQYNSAVVMNFYWPVVNKGQVLNVEQNIKLDPTFYDPIIFKRFISK